MVTCSSCNNKSSSSSRRGEVHVQLQQGQVRVAVVCLALALGHDIVLEGARRLRVVSVQAIEDGLDVLWPFRRKVECGAHGVVCGCECRRGGVQEIPPVRGTVGDSG